ncbi:SDR family oxidoreductase [Leptospira langatensis]|uniref:SDR family oxidoreductase n=1 Tax=Leptospira langatensis TaxID=2484983 RepID=A0A5F1ZWP0_9LEPT|nr:SDR family oxidoreductase [Leptospira langatensis]TGJ98445.1 SDR family oxidoreductase [Leptospira langatensis]TGL43361.1 SDR family oxidoreductase [Leptospira langatensis]
MRFKDKKVLITGGNSGIGFVTAKLMIQEGAKVAITGRDQNTLDSAQIELGENAIAIKADILDPKERENAIRIIQEKFGELDALFANAGIIKPSPLGATSEEDFNQVLHTNLTGAFFTVQAALPLLKKGSSVVLNGSVMSVIGSGGSSAYAASKAGVRAMSRVLATELGSKGIRVNVVVPGATKTPIWGQETPATQARLQAITRSIPMARIGEPEEIAKAVLFLASDDSSYIQGTELVVDGGATGSSAGAPIYLGK